METKALQELSKYHVNNVNNFENIELAWCKSYLAVRGDKTVRVYEFSHNLHRSAKNLDFIQYNLDVSIRSPTAGLFDFLKKGLKGIDLSQFIMDPALWPHSNYLLNEIGYVQSVKWSPGGCLWNNNHILAVMNNTGHVEFYRKQRKQWIVDLELTSHIEAHFKDEINTYPSNVEMVTKLAHILMPCAICFAASMSDDNSVLFVTAHKSGVLIFWLLKEVNKKLTAKYVFQIDTDILDIVTLKWLEKGSQMLLLCSNTMGEINLLECEFQVSNVIVSKTHSLWSQKDRMVAKHCEYLSIEKKQIFFFAKHRHLLVIMLNDKCEVLQQYTHNIHDYKITGLCVQGKDVLMITTNCLFKINYNINNSSLNLSWDVINVKEAYPTSELVCMNMSCNGILLTLGMVDRKIMCKKESLRLEVVNYTTKSFFSEISLLLSNPSKKLTDFWDYIETFICNVAKMKKLPELDYEQLLVESETDVYKLKIYLILLSQSKVLESCYKIPRDSLPENSIDFLKEKLMAMHANEVLNSLYKKSLVIHNRLSKFDTECFVGCRTFLKYFNKKYTTPIKIKPEINTFITDDVNYICQCCNKNIIEFTCKAGHFNNFCSISFTPIESSEYLKCNSCGALARIELSIEKPLCIFCDLYFYEA